jgi:opacity protein-like surface antigen
MNKIKLLAALSVMALFSPAQAEDIKPGLWKISMVSGVAATPDWKPQPFELTQCLTESDAQNPAQLLLGMGSAGATGCDFPRKQQSGNTLSFDVVCAGTLGIRGQGQVTYTATSLDGFLNVSFGGGAEKTDMQNKMSASYVGACPAGGGL